MTDTHTHRQTDRHTTTAYTALSKASRGKKKEITEGKIYSPVGRFAERAKQYGKYISLHITKPSLKDEPRPQATGIEKLVKLERVVPEICVFRD